ncbi:MAG: 50S ribosomal protein L22 [Alphaproteobacteria bacterium]
MGKKKRASLIEDNEALAVLVRYRCSPQKLNLVAQLIRGLSVEKALAELTFCKRRHAIAVKKLLESAIANAENNKNLDIDRLFVKEAIVGDDLVMKRFRARARGRGTKILKPFSRLRIIVKERAEEQEKAVKASPAKGEKA